MAWFVVGFGLGLGLVWFGFGLVWFGWFGLGLWFGFGLVWFGSLVGWLGWCSMVVMSCLWFGECLEYGIYVDVGSVFQVFKMVWNLHVVFVWRDLS